MLEKYLQNVVDSMPSILVGVDYLEASFKSLRRGVHNRLEHWRHGAEPSVSSRRDDLGSGIEK